MMKGKLEFVEGTRKNNHFELIRVEFEVSNEADPAGEGTYYIYSKHYPRQPLRCVSDCRCAKKRFRHLARSLRRWA